VGNLDAVFQGKGDDEWDEWWGFEGKGYRFLAATSSAAWIGLPGKSEPWQLCHFLLSRMGPNQRGEAFG